MLTQYVGDQAYLAQYANQHPKAYWFWLLLSDCGRSISLLGFWSLIASLLFAVLYTLIGFDSFSFNNFPVSEGSISKIPTMSMIYYSIVTFTTLGFGDITPLTNEAMLAVIAEVVSGYIFLGMLVSILATKVARRS